MPVALRRPDAEAAEVLLTFEDFIRMDHDGYFKDLGKRTELINGRICGSAPVSGGHGNTQASVIIALDRHLGGRIAALNARSWATSPSKSG
jgi:Uma2 family endonuclease